MINESLKEIFVKDLIEKRTVYLSGEIHRDMAVDIGRAIVWLNARDDSEEIRLYIDSSGGSVAAGLDIYDIIKHSKAPITGIVYRKANSMASVILQGCAKRQAMGHAEIVIHNITSRPIRSDEFEGDRLKKVVEEIGKNQRDVYEVLANRSGRTIAEVAKKCLEDVSMTAAEAKDFGLIDEII